MNNKKKINIIGSTLGIGALFGYGMYKCYEYLTTNVVAVENSPKTPQDVNCPTRKRHPVVFVPGIGGSIIEARKHGTIIKWFRLYLDILKTIILEEYILNMCLLYDRITQRSRNCKHIAETRVPDFGKMKSMNYIDTNPLLYYIPYVYNKTKYAVSMSELFGKLGYKQDIDLVAAPYDFR